MIRARAWGRRDGRHTVRVWVPAGESHAIEAIGPARIHFVGHPSSHDLVVPPGHLTRFNALRGPLSYVARYG